MALNKKDKFNKEEIELSDFAKSIAHPARIAILKVLAKHNTCICGEIVEVLPLAQSTVSQHLKALQKAGLIKGTIDGAKSCYCIDGKKFNKFISAFEELSDKLKNTNSNCC